MARTRKKATKRTSRKGALRRRVRAMGRVVPRPPARRKGESLVKYHDRLSNLIYEADQAGDVELSHALQVRAGELAAKYPSIHRPRRGKRKPQRGPGTYPWGQCIEDQAERYGSTERARKVCGRIRADSRARYPIYWSLRGRTRKKNPAEPDYAIIAAEDGTGWHWWVSDERRQHLAAASTKPESDEEAAIQAAKRAIRRYDERTHGEAKAKKASKKQSAKTSGARKRSLSSILGI